MKFLGSSTESGTLSIVAPDPLPHGGSIHSEGDKDRKGVRREQEERHLSQRVTNQESKDDRREVGKCDV